MENTGVTYPFTPAHTGLTDLRTALGDWSVSIEEGTTDYIPLEDTMPGLKRYYNGWQNGDLIIIGGRHGAGKTSLILDILKATSIDHDIPSLCIVPQSKSSSILLRLIRKYSDQYGGNSPDVIGNEKYIIFGKMEYIRISNNDASFSVTMVHRFR